MCNLCVPGLLPKSVFAIFVLPESMCLQCVFFVSLLCSYGVCNLRVVGVCVFAICKLCVSNDDVLAIYNVCVAGRCVFAA